MLNYQRDPEGISHILKHQAVTNQIRFPPSKINRIFAKELKGSRSGPCHRTAIRHHWSDLHGHLGSPSAGNRGSNIKPPTNPSLKNWGPKSELLVGGFHHLEKYESQWEGLSHI
jgi:hypothetical protein